MTTLSRSVECWIKKCNECSGRSLIISSDGTFKENEYSYCDCICHKRSSILQLKVQTKDRQIEKEIERMIIESPQTKMLEAFEVSQRIEEEIECKLDKIHSIPPAEYKGR